jgi:hypothetical protein
MSQTLSAMLWFRADPAEDPAVRAALARLAEAIAPDAAARIGHRHEEDRPYRTWMLDAGPVPAERFDALLYRIHKNIGSTGLADLVQGEPHLESFAWHSPEA